MGQSKAALPCCSCWVLHIMVRTCVVVQLYVSLLGSTRCHWALLIAVGLYASLVDPTHRGCAVCVVVGLYALLLGLTCRNWAGHVVMGPSAMSFATLPHCTQVLGWACHHGALCHVVCHSTSLYAGVGLFMSS